MKLNSIQYLRGLAAVAVAIYHCVTIMNKRSVFDFFHVGAFGVDLFFVISGFIMVVSTGPQVSVSTFISKRILRIVPLYWVATLLMGAVILLFPTGLESSRLGLSEMVMSLFFVPHYHPVVADKIWPLLIQGWSLNYEMFFYALFAVGIVVAPRRKELFLVIAIAALFLLGRILQPSAAIPRTYTSPLLAEFAMGVLIGWAFSRGKLHHALIGFATLGVLFAVLGVSGAYYSRWLSVGSICSLLVCLAIYSETKGVVFESRFLLLLGNASFSIYLFHAFALGAIRMVGNRMQIDWTRLHVDMATILVGTAASIAVGCVIYLTVEKSLNHITGELRRSWIGGTVPRADAT